MSESSFPSLSALENSSEFVARHIGPDADEQARMLAVIAPGRPGFTRQALIEAVVPRDIARSSPMALPPAVTEADALAELREIGRAHV